MNVSIIRNKGLFLKRITTVITAGVFLSTQCGLGMALPVYRQKAENLRAKAIGETNVSGKQGKIASAIGEEFKADAAGVRTEAMGAGKQTTKISDEEFEKQRDFIWTFLKMHNIKKEKLIVFDEEKRLELDLSDCKLSDIGFLENITSLKALNLSNNQISDIKPLEKLINLEWLLFYDNQKIFKNSLHNLTRHCQRVRIYNDYGMPISFGSTVAGVPAEAMGSGIIKPQAAGRIIFVISNQPEDIAEEVKTQAGELISENDQLVPILVSSAEGINEALKRIQRTQGEYSVVMHITDDITGISNTIMDAASSYSIQILNLPNDRNKWKAAINTSL